MSNQVFEKRRSPAGYLKVVFVAVFFGSRATFLLLEHYYVKICPLKPDLQGGHIYPHQIHGGTIFLTLAERRMFIGIDVFTYALLILCVALMAWLKIASKQMHD